MIDVEEKKRKIISFLEQNGPSLPVRIAKTIEMDPMFASAILSELLGAHKIKMSHMKIGASALYLIPGQENQLENFIEHLKSAEKEAYSKLKKGIPIKDKDEEPATRVALRNIKDFAIPFKQNDEIMWKYAFETEKTKEESVQKEEPKERTEPIQKKPKEPEPTPEPKPKKETEQKPLEPIFEEKTEEPKPEFLLEVKEFLEEKGIDFLEEIQSEKKEIVAKVSINSTLGKINFLMIAKNKKTISREEINASIQRARYNKMPCLLVLKKEPSKTMQTLIDENHLIKLEIMPN